MAQMGIEIKNGIATISLDCDQLSILAKACETASQYTSHISRQPDIIAFRAFAMMFKSATIASLSQISMRIGDGEQAEKFAEELLSVE